MCKMHTVDKLEYDVLHDHGVLVLVACSVVLPLVAVLEQPAADFVEKLNAERVEDTELNFECGVCWI